MELVFTKKVEGVIVYISQIIAALSVQVEAYKVYRVMISWVRLVVVVIVCPSQLQPQQLQALQHLHRLIPQQLRRASQVQTRLLSLIL